MEKAYQNLDIQFLPDHSVSSSLGDLEHMVSTELLSNLVLTKLHSFTDYFIP